MWPLYILLYMVVVRTIYIKHVIAVEKRPLKRKVYWETRQAYGANRKHQAWHRDSWAMAPITGDIYLFVTVWYWLFAILARYANNFVDEKEKARRSKEKELKKQVTALETRLKKEAPGSLVAANAEMVRAIQEVESLTKMA